MYRLISKCRACESSDLIPVVDLGVQPLANDYVKTGELHAGYAPLKVLFCPRCTLAQLSVVVRPELLYRHYSYVTSNSQIMRDHFESLTKTMLEEHPETGSVVEIGSNDGLLLAHLKEHGFGNLCGIEPAANLADIATKRGVHTLNEFFDLASAHAARSIVGDPNFILARHVFCHMHDWAGFFRSANALSGKTTVIAIEVPYVMDMLTALSWDTIYHEHLSYLSLKAVKALLAETAFHLHRVVKFPIHGGAILLLIRRNDSTVEPHPSVARMLDEENITEETWRKFNVEMTERIAQLGALVRTLVSGGKTVCGYGASAKSTVWISACGFTRKEIHYICDDTPNKQWTTSPGTDIPIVDPAGFRRDFPHYAVLWAWNYASEIIGKENLFKDHGGKWILPVPEVQVV